jgi:hypothetical protein
MHTPFDFLKQCRNSELYTTLCMSNFAVLQGYGIRIYVTRTVNRKSIEKGREQSWKIWEIFLLSLSVYHKLICSIFDQLKARPTDGWSKVNPQSRSRSLQNLHNLKNQLFNQQSRSRSL